MVDQIVEDPSRASLGGERRELTVLFSDMGAQARFSYTVLGGTVNLGARLEGLTKQYRVNILVGETTAQLSEERFAFRELDWVRVKGRAGTSRIYELLGERGASEITEDALVVFADGLTVYREGDWDAAEARFREFLERYPNDGPSAGETGAQWDARRQTARVIAADCVLDAPSMSNYLLDTH